MATLTRFALVAALVAAAVALAQSPTAKQAQQSPETDRVEAESHALALIETHVEGLVMGQISEVHQEMIARIEAGETLGHSEAPVALCFQPGTPDGTLESFYAALERSDPDRFQLTGRWSGAVASGAAGSTGEAITLTYSFVPDGTFIPSGVGEPAGNSDLFAFLNGIYGSPAVWQALYAQMFARWSTLSGLNFVHELNDDGAAMFNPGGVLGVRGDLRMAGKFIDGNSGTLAYNFFPNTGDMVIDTGDSYFSNTGSNSRRLRNVLSHEHGHGMGLLHVCPINVTKLMEPFVTTSYDGPRHDDIRGAQDHYGDAFEPDNSSGAATALGTASPPTTYVPSTVPAPSVSNGSLLSIDQNGEQDWFTFSTDAASSLDITLVPLGLNYDDSIQSGGCGGAGFCCSGSFTDSSVICNLALQLVGSDGSTVLATSDGGGLGAIESILGFASASADTFYVRVYETSGFFSETQLYALSIDVVPPPPPGAFNLVTPANGATGVESGPVMDWDASAGAATYLLEVDDSAAFTSPIVSETVNDPATSFDIAEFTLASLTQYFWRVTAENPQGTQLSTPAISGFTTADFTPPTCCDGDIDGDCDTDTLDFAIFAPNFGTSGHPPFTNGDLDGDGDVDTLDFAVFAPDFGCTP